MITKNYFLVNQVLYCWIMVYQQLILGTYWFRAQLLAINCWFIGICGFGTNNGNVANGCSINFGAGEHM